jgi:hypothetical protein
VEVERCFLGLQPSAVPVIPIRSQILPVGLSVAPQHIQNSILEHQVAMNAANKEQSYLESIFFASTCSYAY